MEKSEKAEDMIEVSKSAMVLKTIYSVLIVVIIINCIILIASILTKPDKAPIVSKFKVINTNDINFNNNPESNIETSNNLPIPEENI